MDKINPFLAATTTAAFASTRLHTLGLQPRPSRPVFESRERAIYSAYCADHDGVSGSIRGHGSRPLWCFVLMLFCYLILRLLSFCGSCGGQWGWPRRGSLESSHGAQAAKVAAPDDHTVGLGHGGVLRRRRRTNGTQGGM